jgi:competence protein ComEC
MYLKNQRCSILSTLFLFCITILLPLWSNADDLKIHFIDIGQGDSALIESPTHKVILIDSGPNKSKKRLFEYLKKRDIKKIDLMINSHPHADHIGNAAAVIRDFKVKTILDSGFNHPIRAYRNLLTQAEESKAKMRLGRKGRVIQIGGGAFIEILSPGDSFLMNSRSDPNANSIVFRLVYKDQSVLFTGDAEEETEDFLLKDPQFLKATVLKVAHHGSRHASSPSFFKSSFSSICCDFV